MNNTYSIGQRFHPSSAPAPGPFSDYMLAELLTMHEEMIEQHQSAATMLRALLENNKAELA
jgi:hypothetical protein